MARYRGAVSGPETKPETKRRLVLLRHAKSDWPDVPDQDRPLAKRGRRDAPVAGGWLGRSGYVPDAVVCSTARRARETWERAAEGLAAAVPGAAPQVRYEPRVYEATVLGLLMLVREFPDGWRTAMIVGHNPGMAELTVGLTAPPPDPPSAFPTAAIAVLGLPGGWADAGPGEARLLAFAVPADMRLPRQHGPDLAGDLLVLAGGDHEGAHPRAVGADVVVVGAVPRVA
jgi:phosphohistidine phosphatase